jgi:hypothetical protein
MIAGHSQPLGRTLILLISILKMEIARSSEILLFAEKITGCRSSQNHTVNIYCRVNMKTNVPYIYLI